MSGASDGLWPPMGGGIKPPADPIFNLGDEVGATVEYLNALGQILDIDTATEFVRTSYDAVVERAGVPGELYIDVPSARTPLRSILAVMDGHKASEASTPTFEYPELWIPKEGRNNYSEEDTGNLGTPNSEGWDMHARLAVHNPTDPAEPLLHFRGMPFNTESIVYEAGQETQLDALALAVNTYNAAHPDMAMGALSVRAVALLMFKRRILGTSTKGKIIRMPVENGYLRDGTLAPRSVGGSLFVGRVGIYGSQLTLGKSPLIADMRSGLGLSVGPKEPPSLSP